MKETDRGVRGLPRRTLRVEVTLEDRTLPGEIVLDALNVSPSGIFLLADLLMDEGEEFDLSFSLPGVAGPIRARGSVVRVEKDDSFCLPGWQAGMGVRFLTIAPEDLARLYGYIGLRAGEE